MKKISYSLFLVILSAILAFSSVTAFAETDENPAEGQNIALSQEEFSAVSAENPDNAVSPCATGLITSCSVSIKKSGNTLTIAGVTKCIPEVKKCGFKEINLQRKLSTSSTWSEYITYEDYYVDSNEYYLSKTLTVPSGYQYRVVCTHYAKKNIFSTQKIDNTSNIVT